MSALLAPIFRIKPLIYLRLPGEMLFLVKNLAPRRSAGLGAYDAATAIDWRPVPATFAVSAGFSTTITE